MCNRNGTRIYNIMTGMKMKQEIDGENGGGGGIEKLEDKEIKIGSMVC